MTFAKRSSLDLSLLHHWIERERRIWNYMNRLVARQLLGSLNKPFAILFTIFPISFEVLFR